MTNDKKLTRHKARSLAFQFLYGHAPEAKTGKPSENMSYTQAQFDAFCASFGTQPDGFAYELARGVGEKLQDIDTKISSLSTNWRIERIPSIDLNILRLACYEIIYGTDTPKPVAIDEAVELAKEFGEKDSASFINGILDQISK